jgi:hypothetical protein
MRSIFGPPCLKTKIVPPSAGKDRIMITTKDVSAATAQEKLDTITSIHELVFGREMNPEDVECFKVQLATQDYVVVRDWFLKNAADRILQDQQIIANAKNFQDAIDRANSESEQVPL